MSSTLRFDDGATQFRLRLACSLLSQRPLVLTNIRADEVERSPGLLPHEASFLRLLDTVTNGTRVEINSTGTQLRFVPGVLTGGRFEHECPNTKNVGWFVEGLLPLAPFGKEPLEIVLGGVTEGLGDVSADRLAETYLPLYARFGVEEEDGAGAPGGGGPSCRVSTRGAAPSGGGRVRFHCPIVKTLRPLDLVDVGLYKRVRGKVVACKTAPSAANRAAKTAKGLLHRLLPDVWIHTDVRSSNSKITSNGCGPDPGLGITLAAETTEGIVVAAERTLNNNDDDDGRRRRELPEDLGLAGAASLLEEIRRGGCVDGPATSFVLLLMCLGPEDVARVRVGTLDPYAISALRLLRRVFGITFKIRTDTETRTVTLSCLGSGYKNMVKAST